MSQPRHRQLEHLPLGRIRQRVLSQFWLGFAGPWDILTQKQAVCLWGQSCEGLRWCHIAGLSHKLSPSQRRDQLPVASEQRHPGDIFQGSPGGRSCYDVFWNHTGFCLISCMCCPVVVTLHTARLASGCGPFLRYQALCWYVASEQNGVPFEFSQLGYDTCPSGMVYWIS